MPMTAEQLFAEARRLPRQQVAELMDLLLVETVAVPDGEIDEAWAREIDRRLAELESGKVKTIPSEQVLADLRKIVGL
jgi:putative addiction module component (TIGR02574 family)